MQSSTMKLSEREVKLRKPVWIALAELYLDTDSSLSYEYVVKVCAASKYTTDELEAILRNEVAPAVSGNLLSVAGEWSGFDENWLVKEIRKRCENQPSIFQSAKNYLKKLCFQDYTNDHWQIILPKINEARLKF